jgi:hypothetical protein
MTTSRDLAAALEAFIQDEVDRRVAAAMAEVAAAPPMPLDRTSRAGVWLSAREAGERAGRHPETVTGACRSGELFATQRVVGRPWRIRPESVDARVEGTPDPHREQVERWQRGPKQPLKPRKRRPRPSEPDPDGPVVA